VAAGTLAGGYLLYPTRTRPVAIPTRGSWRRPTATAAGASAGVGGRRRPRRAVVFAGGGVRSGSTGCRTVGVVVDAAVRLLRAAGASIPLRAAVSGTWLSNDDTRRPLIVVWGSTEGLHAPEARRGFVTGSRSCSCLSLATEAISCFGPIGWWFVGGLPSEVGADGSFASMLGNNNP
jgi:hypothetical protein